MKKYVVGILLWAVVTQIFAQTNDQISFLKSPDSYIYIDNTPGAHFTIEFPGDTFRQAELTNGFVIDDQIVQVIKFEYSRDQYTNTASTEAEIALLEGYMEYELRYLQKEVFKKKLAHSHEVFLNEEGKRFMLWQYELPSKKRKKYAKKGDPAVHQLFLTCICNRYLCGVNMPVFSQDTLEVVIGRIKGIANRFDIFGGPIDKDALYYKVEVEKQGDLLQIADSIRKFEWDIPTWANLMKTNRQSVWMLSMPDLNNVKNAVSLRWFEKSDFESFAGFNAQQIVERKIGDTTDTKGMLILREEMTAPDACNGVSYKAHVLFGKTIYHCQYVTYASETAYFLFHFVATKETYEVNWGKLEELLDGFRIVN